MDSRIAPTSRRWAILAVIFIGCVMGSFVQFTTSAFGMYLMENFGMSPSQFSAVTMAPMFTGIIFSIPAGLWADKKGVRLTVAIAGALSIGGGFLRIISTNFTLLLISMILIGFIAVFISANCVKLISEWFPRKETSLAMGVFMSGGGAGNAIAQAITPYFGTFRNASIICLVIMIIAYVLFLIVVTDRPKGAQAPPPDVAISETIGNLLKLKHVWIIGFAMVMFMVANMTTSIFLVTGL
jgi:nitrate/nitrite transporter NarK